MGTSASKPDSLSIANHPAKRVPGPRLLHHLVARASHKSPLAIDFLSTSGQRTSLSYASLHEASDVLANRISALAGGSNYSSPFVVPVLIPQSLELYIAILAILKVGGAFCPINLDVPSSRTKFILEDVSAKLVITTSELAGNLPAGNYSVLLVDNERGVAAVGKRSSHRKSTPSDLAYVMYTSGSTGTPKGVGVSHDAATQSLLAHERHIPPFSRFLQFAAPTFDVSVFEIFFPLFRGKTLVACARSTMLNDLPAVIRDMEVDACELTPSVAGSLLRTRQNAPGLRLLLTIGEMLTQPVVEEFGGADGRRSILWGMYGPTEAAIHCTLQAEFASRSAVQNIGVPIDTVSAFILNIPTEHSTNQAISVLPRGEIGELALGGYQLAQGYLNRPEQTSVAFIDSSYGRLYRTGDKARMLLDGTLECLGRIADGQVKLRGQRMELGEIEQAALKTPGCHSAAATVKEATLILFCAVDDGSGDIRDAILQSCKQWLPGFMVPNEIVMVPSFPRLASGKVDRNTLAAEHGTQTIGSSLDIPYRDALEEQLCAVTGTFLGVQVQPDQDLSKSGLDSLTAIKLASLLRDAGFRVGAIDLLADRSVSAIHKRILSGLGAGIPPAGPRMNVAHSRPDIPDVVADNPVLAASGRAVESILPCTPLQRSMLAETMANSRTYCNWVELRIDGPHPREIVRSWFLQLAQSNEALRTGFVRHDGRIMQVVFEQPLPSIIVLADSIDREFELREEADFLCPFRVWLSQTQGSVSTTAILQIHHAVYDGWSLDLLLYDLERLAQGQELAVRPQFRRVLEHQLSEEYAQNRDAATEFWAGNLQGFQPPGLLVLNPETNHTPTVLSATVPVPIDPKALREGLQSVECGPQTIFQAALAWLWSSMVGSEDVVVGSIQSGRTLPVSRIEDIVGLCITAVPLRTNLSQVRTVRDLLLGVHAGNRAAMPHGVLSLPDIKRSAGIRPGQSLYDVLFVYQESLNNQSSTSIIKQVAHHDYLETKLLVEVEPRGAHFDCRFTYHSDAFPESQVRIMAELIPALVSRILSNMDVELTTLRSAFPDHLLSIFNPTPKTVFGTLDLATAVEQTAVEFPHKDAVCFVDNISDGVISTTTITFAELNNMANCISGHLLEHGVGEGDVVAIVMEKSIRLYAGILAILKAGCAYLPLLPSTPVKRIQGIFQQADVGLCLVDTVTQKKWDPELSCRFLNIESISLTKPVGQYDKPQPDTARLAYIIYTSGSTGVPKGVCLTQLNIMSNLDVLSRIYPVKETSRLLQSCSQAFDVSVFEIFFAWTRGLCLCSATNDMLFEDLERSIRKLNVTHLSMTPTVASLVDPVNVPCVEFLVTAGEAMTESVARQWGDKLFQGYGPSETTNICSVKQMGPNQAVQHLGRSFGNTSTFVMHQDSTEIVPVGCLGEFCFGGDQVARGYLKMEELTAAKFIHHPKFGRLYRSGDLGRMLPDGSMVIVGRADEQIKIRGQRVELDEINAAIRESGYTECATLFLKEGETGMRDQITSFIVLNKQDTDGCQVLEVDDGLRSNIQSLYQSLNSQLPTYMIPSAVIPISSIPITTSGKLDRTRLKQAFADIQKRQLGAVNCGAASDVDDKEWSDTEKKIARAICSALNVDKVDLHRWTPLATLGLDSISAIQVSRKISDTLGKRLPISAILQNTSVARLARITSKLNDGEAKQVQVPDFLPQHALDDVAGRLGEAGISFSKVLPCMPLQEAMLTASLTGGQYLNRMLFKITGDFEKVRAAWNAMVLRHDILRTCFVSGVDTQWPILQVVLDPWTVSWNEFEGSIDQCVAKHAQTLPPAVDSLIPAVAFATVKHGDDTFLSFVCHHALYDGVAVEKLLHEVEKHVTGEPLPPVPSSERFLEQSLKVTKSTDVFWLDHLAGYQPKFVLDLQSNPSEPFDIRHSLDIPLSEVIAKTRDLGVSLLAVVQAGWAATLASIFQVRMNLSRQPRNLDLLRAFHTLSAQLLQHQFTPLRRIRSLIPGNSESYLFDTLLLLQPSPRPLDSSIWTLERDHGETDVPLVCELTPDHHADALNIKIHTIESKAFPVGLVELIYDLFVHALAHSLQFPGSRTSHVSLPSVLVERLSHVIYRRPAPTVAVEKPDEPDEIWTNLEVTIRDVLAEFAARSPEHIRRETTIYQLGLDSISAVLVASALRKRGYEMLASDIITHPTCASLAQYLEARTPESSSRQMYDIAAFQTQVWDQVLDQGIPMTTIEAILPCTPLQSGMMAQFIKSGGRDYFNFINFDVGPGVDIKGLADAWGTVSRAHTILRTSIVPVEHDDCAFAMVQRGLDPAGSSAVTSVQPSPGFDIRGWQRDTAEAACKAPHTGLWAVALVEQGEMIEMHLAIHHALYDAYSLQTILDDLARAANCESISSERGSLGAVADIMGQALSESEASTNFWIEKAGDVVINTFPVLTPLRETSRVVLAECITSATSLSELEDAASKSGHTLQVILQAAWTRVLCAYLGEESVVFGVVLSGRNTEATRDAAFPCITTLPVVSRNNNSNHALLAQMLQYNTELSAQQHQPLTRIQQRLGCSDAKLFDTLLVYQKFGRSTANSPPWRVVKEDAFIDFPISIEVEPSTDGSLKHQITFFSDVLSNEQASLLLRQFDAAVQHLAFYPSGQDADLFGQCPGVFSVLPAETPVIPTSVRYLHQFVELSARQSPAATALHFVDRFDNDVPVGRKWTYKDLDDNGNRVAHLLTPHARPGDIVAVCFGKCPEAYFSILGVLKTGCAFVALDPSAPRARNEFILKDSGAVALVASNNMKSNLEVLPGVERLVVDLDSLSSIPPVPLALEPAVQPSDVCYCLYTSGTTGTPKGCEITHDNAVQCMLAFQHIFEGHWQQDSRWLQFAALHFDVSVLEQYWTWSVGITLVAAPRDLILEDLTGVISRLEITHIDLTPSLARLLHPDDVPSLCKGVFITGGESLKQEILDVWGSKAVIYNFYGPTEATIGVTAFPRVPTTGRASNIGRQFINVGSYVLKPDSEDPVLRGAVGELCVSGRLVGKGYLHRDDLTALKFPTLQRFGERVYRTGDLVRVLHDGCFEFLGRADDQVKLRGQRLEIGEINHTIRKGVNTVQDVATLVVRNEAQRKDLLVSFITAVKGTKPRGPDARLELMTSPEAVALCQRTRDACRSKLPGYMVPTYVLPVAFIPLSSNNKAEIKQLRHFFVSLNSEHLISLSSSGNTVQKLDAAGKKIAAVIARMQKLDIRSITSNSNIFELGVDSLSVLRLCRALKKEGFVHASVSLIMQQPVMKDLSKALASKETRGNSALVTEARQLIRGCGHTYRALVCRELATTAAEIEYIAPCSPLQQGMMSKSVTDNAYFNAFQLSLTSETSIERLRDALRKTVDDLPILRTAFLATPEGVVQVALKRRSLPWYNIHAGGQSVAEVMMTARDSWISRNQDTLSQPIEAVLVEEEGARLLVLHIFHGLYDANSLKLVLDRVVEEYRALENRPRRFDPETAPSFLDAMCHGPLQNFESSKSFWLAHLSCATPTVLSEIGDLPVRFEERRVRFEELELLKTRLGVTHQALVQAAWVAVLSKHTINGPTIGIIVSGRNMKLDGAENVVGPLFNTLPFHARITPGQGMTWSSLIRQCHDFNITALGFEHVPLRDIQKWCSNGRPLFDTLFSFQRDEPTPGEQHPLWRLIDAPPNPDYPLALEATLDLSHSLRLLIVRRGDFVGVEGLMDDLEQAFMAMANDDDGVVGVGTPLIVTGQGEIPRGEYVPDGALLNKVPRSTATDTSFSWTVEAIEIRNAVATLADTDLGTINETTPLFGLGLDSIDLIRLSAMLKTKGIQIKTNEVMKAQTISAMANLLRTRARGPQPSEINATAQHMASEVTSFREHVRGTAAVGDDDIVLPVTHLQKAMVVGMIESDFQLYFNHDIMELAVSVDMDRLKDAWQAVIAGSPILRTRFLAVNGPTSKASYCQIISNESSGHITDMQLETKDELAKVCDAAMLRAKKGSGASELLQLAFVSVGAQRFLVLSIAHALYDGWSLGLLHRDVHDAYHGSYHPSDIQAYTKQVAELVSHHDPDAAGFWAGYLQDVEPTLLPSRTVTRESIIHRTEVSSSTRTTTIIQFCKANAVTLQTLGQACWSAYLAARTGSLDVTFGAVLSCRDTASLETLRFPTINTVVIRSVLHGTVSSWLQYMQRNINEINCHPHLALRDARNLAKARGPLFNTLFIHQRGPSSNPNQPTHPQLMVSADGNANANANVEYPVCVETEMTEDGFVWRSACSATYVSPAESSRVLRELDSTLGNIVKYPEGNVLRILNGMQVTVCDRGPITIRHPDISLRAKNEDSKVDGGQVNEDGLEEGKANAAKWAPFEILIRDVFAALLEVPPEVIRRSDNVFHLGLDCLEAVRASSLFRKAGITIPFTEMVMGKTIPELAFLALENRGKEARPSPKDDGLEKGFNTFFGREILDDACIDEASVEAIVPATPQQVHMLAVSQNTQGDLFFPVFRYTLPGHLELLTIAGAWDTLVADLPILRTAFLPSNSPSAPVLQVVFKPVYLGAQISNNNTSYQNHPPENTSQPYHTLRVERSGDVWDIELRIHHALYDAVSLSAMLDRFVALCCSACPAASTFNWATIYSQLHSTVADTERREYWINYMHNDEHELLFPLSSSGTPAKPRIDVVRQGAIKNARSLIDVCKKRGVTLQALFFAAYAESVARLADRRPSNVVFGVYLANRTDHDQPGAEFYPLLRLVPLCLRFWTRDLLELAATVQRMILTISKRVYNEAGLWEIKEWTGVTVDSFVNFLPRRKAMVGESQGLSLELGKSSINRTLDEGIQGLDGTPKDVVSIVPDSVRDAFPDPVDVEASMEGDEMTIGVFCPPERLDTNGAEKLLDCIVHVLTEIVE
ncbi:non-ribosomal peptide synthetase [Dichotomopilus funicola]|uniref:Non-ribosomal peptide synthetase n=1 Tax=Dichotomopilus funicola TaxID=1934379 RepID=A0AAN6UUE1_9PEZI|nr:non-ribosomal peptide synthetase [Dichotomopilus funicola]